MIPYKNKNRILRVGSYNCDFLVSRNFKLCFWNVGLLFKWMKSHYRSQRAIDCEKISLVKHVKSRISRGFGLTPFSPCPRRTVLTVSARVRRSSVFATNARTSSDLTRDRYQPRGTWAGDRCVSNGAARQHMYGLRKMAPRPVPSGVRRRDGKTRRGGEQ